MLIQLVITSLAQIILVYGENADDVPLHRTERAISACQTANVLKKYSFIPDHTACLSPSSEMNRTFTGVSEAEKVEIINVHNQHRVSEDASNMNKVSWDDEVAYIAQKWADNCVFQHEGGLKRRIPGRFYLGQNLFASTGKSPWTTAITAWYNEIQYFTYNATDNVLSQVGHYVQVVTAKTLKVGCGYTLCQYEDGRISHFYVCNYGPGGSGGLKTPFKRGTKCADCSSNCDGNLCNCDRVCLNGGTLDLSSCTCSCPAGYESSDCSLNCTSKTDVHWCTGHTMDSCARYSNIPEACPHKCDICPNAGVDMTGLSDGRGAINFDLTGVDIYGGGGGGQGGNGSNNIFSKAHLLTMLFVFVNIKFILKYMAN